MRFVKSLAVLGLSVLLNWLVIRLFVYWFILQIEEWKREHVQLSLGDPWFPVSPTLDLWYAVVVASAAGAIPLGIYFTLVQDARSAAATTWAYLLIIMGLMLAYGGSIAEVVMSVAGVGIGALAGYSAGAFLGRRVQPLFWERARVMG